jgi:hypothetical protein
MTGGQFTRVPNFAYFTVYVASINKLCIFALNVLLFLISETLKMYCILIQHELVILPAVTDCVRCGL